MNQNGGRRLVRIVEFTIRNDKDLGLLVEKFETDNEEFFFKNHDKPIQRHCDQLKTIIKAADVKRTKKIRVDIAKFANEYFRDRIPTFKGVPLKSSKQQIEKLCELYVNKDIGAMKRTATLAQNKAQKVSEYNAKILAKMEEAETRFQEQRAIRIHELVGGKGTGAPRGPKGPPGTATSQQDQSSSQVQITPRVPMAAVTPQRPKDQDLQRPMDQDLQRPMDQDLSDEEF